MYKRTVFIIVGLMILSMPLAFAQVEAQAEPQAAAQPQVELPVQPEAQQLATESQEISKEKVIAIATAAVKGKGFNLDEVNVIYDENGKLWSEKIGVITTEDKSPNFGILKKGFLKNYRTVYFDFKDPLPDLWVFIDKDTGEVFEVYRER